MPILENADPLEPRLNVDTGRASDPARRNADAPEIELGQDEFREVDEGVDVDKLDDAEVLAFLGEAHRLSRSYQTMAVLAQWEQSHAAYRSEHSSGSKYKKDQYKNRAKYFKPKTRSAVRKNLTATANALFASQDVMSCDANDDGNVLQRANAALIKEIINARFASKSVKMGVPWYQTALGARHDAQLQGICCSKQTWRFRTMSKPITRQEERPLTYPDDDSPMIDQMTGEQMMQIVDVDDVQVDVLEDRPDITLFPGEHVLLDAGTSWINPAQNSPTLIILHPMHVDDVRSMMKAEENGTPWRTVSDEQLAGAYYSETAIMGIKAAREGAGARVTTTRSTAKLGGNRNEIVDVRECFFRRGGIDYHCWVLKNVALLSDPVPVIQSYPAHRGIRPYVFGTDTLEPHVLYPESHVASWKQAQDEINDFTNLHMDATRQSVFPTAKVVAGKNIDYKSVQRRDGQGIILVRNPEDVTWDRPPGVPAGVYQEGNVLMNDFDELAGAFSQGSVQSNGQLNKTVGGMQLLSSSANSVSEFDLRCWIETWAEPVLSQIVMLEQYYEDDEALLATSGEKAKLFTKFGVDAVTDELLESQIGITLNVGIGASDPMQQLAKFKTVMDIAQPMLLLATQQGKAEIGFEEIFQEIFGKAGYRNGADRFVKMLPEGQKPIPPEMVQQLQQQLEEAGAKIQELEQQVGNKGAELEQKGQISQQQMAVDAKLESDRIQADAKAAYDKELFTLLRTTIVERIKAGTAAESAQLDAKVEAILGLLGPTETAAAA